MCNFWEIWAAFSPRKASLQLCRTSQLPNTSTSGTPHPQNLIKLSSEHTETAHNKGFSTTPAQSIGLQVYLLFIIFSSSRGCAFYYACQVYMYVYRYAASTTRSLPFNLIPIRSCVRMYTVCVCVCVMCE